MGPFGSGFPTYPTSPIPTEREDRRINWWGLGIESSAQALTAGTSLLEARMVGCGRKDVDTYFQVQTVRFGPGLGASGGAALLLGMNIGSTEDLQSAFQPGFGYDLSIGGNSKMLLSAFKTIRPVIESINVATAVREGFRSYKILTQLDEVFTYLVPALQANDARMRKYPAIVAFPYGFGFQISVYYTTVAKVSVFSWRG